MVITGRQTYDQPLRKHEIPSRSAAPTQAQAIYGPRRLADTLLVPFESNPYSKLVDANARCRVAFLCLFADAVPHA